MHTENTHIRFVADKYITVTDGVPKDVVDLMATVLQTYVPMDSFIGVNTRSVDKNVRDSEVRFIQPNESTKFLFDWVLEVANEYKFWFPRIYLDKGRERSKELENIVAEPVQVTTYRQDNYYDWHVDGSVGDSRCLTLIAQLSHPKDYEGGRLEIENVNLDSCVYDLHSVTLTYPHYRHRVTPIQSGTRNSLITWFHAPE